MVGLSRYYYRSLSCNTVLYCIVLYCFLSATIQFSADVVACNRVGGDMAALDTWNLPQSQRGSPTDTIQDVYLFTGSFVNGRISCT